MKKFLRMLSLVMAVIALVSACAVAEEEIPVIEEIHEEAPKAEEPVAEPEPEPEEEEEEVEVIEAYEEEIAEPAKDSKAVEEAAPSKKTVTKEDMLAALNKDRKVEVELTYDGAVVRLGDEITLIAKLFGYGNCEYTLQWQESLDGVNWSDLEGEDGEICKVEITEANCRSYWRVKVIITAVEVA